MLIKKSSKYFRNLPTSEAMASLGKYDGSLICDVSDDIIRDGIVTSQSEDITETATSPFSVQIHILKKYL